MNAGSQIKRPRRYTTLRQAARSAREMHARLECHPVDVLDLINEVNRLRRRESEHLAALDQAANGSHLDDIPNHDDDSLRSIACRLPDGWARKHLLIHADRIDAAISKATGGQQ